MKKIFKNIVLIFLAYLCFLIFWGLRGPAPKRIREMVQNNKHDYDTIAQLYYSYYQYDAGAGVLAYDGGDIPVINCVSDGFNREIWLNDEQYLSVQKIATSYRLGKKDWERVYVYDTFVSFCTINGRESLVYSAKDKRPSYINRPDDDDGIIAVNKITKHWYYVSDWPWP